ncbi:MAG TPA: PilZ domain-containing protein [Burkholderiales bacterium]|nr:PilZ domain-containing protein [Burkholderiales bacterium]
MSRPELRAEPRIPVSFHGTLKLGESSAKCFIQNMCSRGLLIRFTNDLPVGHVLELTCHFPPDIYCKVQVRHVNREFLGARVVEISDEAHAVFSGFLEAQREAWLKQA